MTQNVIALHEIGNLFEHYYRICLNIFFIIILYCTADFLKLINTYGISYTYINLQENLC